ncbi:MAG: ATP-grasp domain-containing protein [Pirellulales bacterium]
MQIADRAYVVPKVTDPRYVDHILDLCRNEDIGLVVPLNDLELPILAHARARFEEYGATAAVSPISVIDHCMDKTATARFLSDHHIRSPRTWETLDAAFAAIDAGETRFPLVVKPCCGSGSICVEFAYDRQELAAYWELLNKKLLRGPLANVGKHDLIIQERLNGQEFGLDIVNDFSGHNVAVFVRKKISMRTGETDHALTIKDAALEHLGRKIGNRLKHYGNLDCDVFVDERGPAVLEFNPRFGGGYPFSHNAGANLPAAYVAWANQHEADEDWFRVRPNVRAAKYDLVTSIESKSLTK